MAGQSSLSVVVESTATKVFASVLGWPGWARAGRTEDEALAALTGYAELYAPVATAAGLALPRRLDFDVVERLPGNATTSFGAPAIPATAEQAAVTAPTARRQAALVEAAWKYLDDVVAKTPEELRKGPRGGGRDRDAMYEHVLNAEDAYARKIGVRSKEVPARRAAILEVLALPAAGGPAGGKGWSTPYAARRIAWHVLDHAWEMTDRSTAEW
jgi:hypothetical protein